MPSVLPEHLRALLEALSQPEVLAADQPSVDLFGERSIVECKTAAKLDTREISGLVAKNVSGFANGEGGVLVLGVDSRKGQGEHAETLNWQLIADPATVAERIRGTLHSLIEPAVSGIDVRPVAQADGSGIVLVGVPSFEGHPVVAVPEKVHGFWVRMGSSTTRMLYRQIAERFVAAPVPHAELEWQWESSETQMDRFQKGNQNQHGTAKVKLVLKNDSAASLKHLFTRLTISGNESIQGQERVWPLINWRFLGSRLSTTARERGFYVNHPPGEAHESRRRTRVVRPDQGQSPLIYPGEELDLFEFSVTTLPDGGGLHSIRIEVQTNADGMMPTDLILALDYFELREVIHNTYA